MTLPVVLRPQARTEIREAYEWYENAQPQLGKRFLGQLNAVISQISDNPLLFSQTFGFQRALVSSFPYCIYYRVEVSAVVVVAVLHGRRDSKRLLKRR